MQNFDAERIWSEILATLEKGMTRSQFDAWLKNTRPLAIENNTLIIATPNLWVRQWLTDRLSEQLQQALLRCTGGRLKLELVVDDGDNSNHDAFEARMEAAVTSVQTVERTRTVTAGQPLNPKYTFDTFVIGSGNRLANAAALAVAQAPAKAYNPLFLYGGVGLGKTHLMQAIAHYVLERKKDVQIVYVSSETFTNEMINAIRDGSTAAFRNRFRNVDILLVDDIQFLAGKEGTQEEFFHTFNALHEANKQIVLTSDRPPKDIPTLEERLRSRFEWGLLSDIQPPDLETRIAILRKKAQLEGFTVPDDVIYYIAERVTSNIRELEGALIRLVAHSSFTGQPITLDIAQHILKDLLPKKPPVRVTISNIQAVIAEHFGLTVEDLKQRKRTRAVAYPRQIAMYLARELTDSSLPRIGAEFGGRDHTTVLHACEKIAKEIEERPDLRETIDLLINKIKQ